MKHKRLIIVLAVLAVPALWLFYASYASPPKGPMGEFVPPDEDVYTAQIINSGISMLRATREVVGDGTYRRDAHAKTHGCMLASFTPKPNLEPALRQGVFADPKTHNAWIRFSSGSTSIQSDWQPDARGMAIKVLGVPGLKLLDGEQDAHTQDFLMINNPVFFIRNVQEYSVLTQYQGQGSQFGYFFRGSKNPSRWELREFRIGLGILKFPPKNLLATQFYSMTAYRLGAQNNVKYSAKPVGCSAKESVPGTWAGFGSNALGADLSDQLKSVPRFCFDLMVQLQVPEKNMPVEDTTIEWKESDSPFVPVARIEIQKQDITQAMQSGFCENLSFTPWHTLPEHQPLGGLNRVRKAVYQGISRYRRCMNHIAFGEPKDDGSLFFDRKTCDPREPVPLITQR